MTLPRQLFEKWAQGIKQTHIFIFGQFLVKSLDTFCYSLKKHDLSFLLFLGIYDKTHSKYAFCVFLIYDKTHNKFAFVLFLFMTIQCTLDLVTTYLVTNLDLVTILQKTIFLVHKNISFSDNLVFSDPSI